MSSVVCFSCLVVVAVLAGVTGLPEQQHDIENQSENKDIRSILADQIDMQGRSACGRTKPACQLSGGKCQSKTTRCEGDFLEGKQYCRKSNKCGCCVPPPIRTPKGCVFGETAYPHGNIIEDTCMQLVCLDGDWKYIGKTHRHCGECVVHGEPHIALYSSYSVTGDVQTYNKTGTFVISQPGLTNKPLFGVYSNFDDCYGWSCVQTSTYFEPGLNVTMVLPSLSTTDHCNNLTVTDPTTDPLCMIKILVNDEERTMDNTVKSYCGTDGNVLVFKHNHTENTTNLNCINVVGSKGFSVSLCQHANDYAWFYVWAMPSLQNKIYGLCDTFPGNEDLGYTHRDGSQTWDYTTSADSWLINANSARTLKMLGVDRCEDKAVASQINEQCKSVIKACPLHIESFYNSCVYDLCRVSNPERYAEGYASHMLLHSRISVSSPKCNCTFQEIRVFPTVFGCFITEAAPADTACQCTLVEWPPIFQYCTGTVVACKDSSSRYCKDPDTSKPSCEQGQGNCGGYWPESH